MSSAITAAAPTPTRSRLVPENSVNVLKGVTWQDYVRYRDDSANDGGRMYYSDGKLLLMTTGPIHERITRLLERLLIVWGEVNRQPVMSFGRWTLQRQLKQKGLEADNCYYVSHLSDVEGKQDIDLESDPPPDLAIEVDITTHSQHKFSICAALGVPEIWVWSEDHVAVYRLASDGTYELVDRSLELREFPLDVTARVLMSHYTRNDMAVMEAYREALAKTS